MSLADLPERITSKIAVDLTSGCWEWTGHRGHFGYGTVRFTLEPGGPPTMKVHRCVWVHVNGPIPDGLWVLHKCDNPPCCNPAHLWLGTAADNNADRDAKGRSRVRGEENVGARLTAEQVRDIRRRRRAGESLKSLMAEFDVSRSAVSAAALGTTWKHVA